MKLFLDLALTAYLQVQILIELPCCQGSSIYKELAYHYYNGTSKSRLNIDKVSKSTLLTPPIFTTFNNLREKTQEYQLVLFGNMTMGKCYYFQEAKPDAK